MRVLAPPDVDPQGAATLWTNLVALLRPAWRRVLGGQPHLGFELTATDAGLTIGLWVPGAVPPGLVERAVEAAWPGARTETVPAAPPLVGRRDRHRRRAAPGPARALPAAHRAQGRPAPPAPRRPRRPRRGRVGLRADPGPPGHRPAPHPPAQGRRGPAGRPARHPHRPTGRPGHPRARPPSPPTPTRPGAATWPTSWTRPPSRAGPSPSATPSPPPPPTARPPARLRGRAHAVASAFALFAGRNRLDRHRLRHPAQVLAERRFGRGDLVSVAELAALAHLPTDQSVPGLARAGAKAVAPPPAVARPPALTARRPRAHPQGARRRPGRRAPPRRPRRPRRPLPPPRHGGHGLGQVDAAHQPRPRRRRRRPRAWW